MSHPGPDVQPPAPQQPEGAWVPPQGAPQAQPRPEPQQRSNRTKWLSAAGTVAVVGIGAAYTLTGGFGIGAPKVDDCVHLVGDNDYELVDCDSSDADYKVVGIENAKLTESEFMNDADSCLTFADAEYAFWESAGMITEKGTVYCAGPL
jgi:hypothetical protein